MERKKKIIYIFKNTKKAIALFNFWCIKNTIFLYVYMKTNHLPLNCFIALFISNLFIFLVLIIYCRICIWFRIHFVAADKASRLLCLVSKTKTQKAKIK